MKKVFFLTTFWLLVMCVQAQVNIGTVKDPHDGAVLDLSQVNLMGLLLPRVALANITNWQLNGSPNGGVGMLVYNTNDNIIGGNGSGVYVWNGSAWAPIKKTTVAVTKVTGFTVTPTVASIYTGSSASFQVSNFTPATASSQGVTWTLNSPYAQITSSSTTQCTIQGLSAGSAVLSIVSLDGAVTKTVNITVMNVTLQSFDLPSALSIKAGEYGYITAHNFIGSNNQPMSGVTVNWSTENGTRQAGSITQGSNTTTITAGTVAGTFKVKATANGITKVCEVTVTTAPQPASCPSGYVIPNGAFIGGPTTAPVSATGSSHGAVIKMFQGASRKDLCVGPDFGSSRNWNTVSAAGWCNANVNDGSNTWRLPNVAELANMQGITNSIPNFTSSGWYWSSTELVDSSGSTATYAVTWNFDRSTMQNYGKATNGMYTRCVKTIN